MISSLVSRTLSTWRRDGSKVDDKFIFPTVDPIVDAPDCEQKCTDCTLKYPSRFRIDNQRRIYGSIKAFASHVLVATGESDWVPRVETIRGSLMEAFANDPRQPEQQRVIVSASNLPVARHINDGEGHSAEDETTVLILPAFVFLDRVTTADISELKERFITRPVTDRQENDSHSRYRLVPRACQRDYVVLLCSHKRRDARCGISAPLIKRELERHMRPLGLHRDESDDRPGGVGIFFVSHVGGHKFAANVLVYRKEAGQMIWLARIRPEHCAGIVKHTILEGKVVHPETQLRGGLDHQSSLTSW